MRGAFPLLAAVVLLACVTAAGADATKPTLSAGLTPPTATVGDEITVELAVTVPAGRRADVPRFPSWGDHWGEAEILGTDAPAKRMLETGAVRWTQHVRLVAFRTGQVKLPPKQVVVPGGDGTVALKTPPDLALAVSSVLPAGADASTLQPKPAAALRSLPWGRAFWWSLAVGLTLLTGAVWWARSRVASETPQTQPAPSLPPFEEFERGLARLATMTDSLRLHLELSRLLRRYLGRTLSFPAIESTTTEIRRRLTGVHMPPDLVHKAVTLLRRCDEVKFARLRRAEDLEAARQEAGGIATLVERHLNPPVEDVGAEEAA